MAGFSIEDAGRLSHAYILASPERAACLHLAGEIAAAAVCERGRNAPCGVCRACRKAQNGIHPDIQTIRREDGKKFVSVDQVRAMTADAYILPNESARKVYIIEEADKLKTPEAQNAALKTLEEPPEGVIFLLCVENAGQLLPTVRSRCVELSTNTEADAETDESRKLARSWLRQVESGDESALLRWCLGQEDLQRDEAAAFLESGEALLLERLREPGLPADARERLWALQSLLERCALYLQANVSIKHILGFLAAQSAAGDGK